MQNFFKVLALAFVMISLAACGTTKKDSEEELGLANGKLKDNGDQENGNGPTRSFEQYCNAMKGTLVIPTICMYPATRDKKPIVVPSPPDNFSGIYRIDLPVMKRGWVVEVIGDANNSGYLYLANNGTLVPFLPVTDTAKVARIEEGTPGLVFIARIKFKTPAEVSIYECVSDQKIFTMCPTPPPR